MNRNEPEYQVQKIRTRYTAKEHTKLDELKALDRKARKPATVFAYLFGTAAALILGSGMSLIMTDIGKTIGLAKPMLPGLVIGLVGLLMAMVNYPIYRRILNRRREKYAEQILALSDSLTRS